MRHGIAIPWLERRLSIRVRLTIWYVSLLAVTVTAFSGLLYFSMAHSLRAENENLLRAHAQQILGDLDIEGGTVTWPEPGQLSAAGTLAAVYDASGVHLLGPRITGVLPDRLDLSKVAAGSVVEVELPVGDAMVLTIPFSVQGVTGGWLVSMRSLKSLDDALFHLLAMTLTAIPFILLVAVGGGLFLAGRALAPIDRITKAAREISHTNLSHRLAPQQRHDEVGRLAATFDEMLGRLEMAFQQQRQFTADASHEMRTPISVVMAQAEEALGRGNSVETQNALMIIKEQALRIGKMVSQLLSLARSDAGQTALPEPEELDLAALVSDVADELRDPAKDKSLRMHVEIPGPVYVLGNQTGLTELFFNLIDNAIRYTPGGGEIRVTVARDDSEALVTVSDTGIGIPASDLPHVFQRFYRVDKTRSRAEGGTGLGLAIARAIVEDHHGRISAVSTPGRGSSFTVVLPALP